MARQLLWKFLRKFGYTSRGCSLFWKFWEMRPEFVFFDYEIFATVLRNECYSARSTGQIIANILSSPSDNRLLAFGKVGKVHWRVNSRFLPVANFPALTTRQMFPRLATEISQVTSQPPMQTFSRLCHEFHMWWAWALWWSSRFLPVSQTLKPSVY